MPRWVAIATHPSCKSGNSAVLATASAKPRSVSACALWHTADVLRELLREGNLWFNLNSKVWKASRSCRDPRRSIWNLKLGLQALKLWKYGSVTEAYFHWVAAYSCVSPHWLAQWQWRFYAPLLLPPLCGVWSIGTELTIDQTIDINLHLSRIFQSFWLRRQLPNWLQISGLD